MCTAVSAAERLRWNKEKEEEKREKWQHFMGILSCNRCVIVEQKEQVNRHETFCDSGVHLWNLKPHQLNAENSAASCLLYAHEA